MILVHPILSNNLFPKVLCIQFFFISIEPHVMNTNACVIKKETIQLCIEYRIKPNRATIKCN